ncbi:MULTISPECIES: 5-formyltetrahydrofolate cyclo-ligase [unclassified Actinopolyspora]|uniref:5-formyltetrahydrofolate cyclo-ligase n=1 Tax=unclassified Actinopolyspora TaxID=2639451 RepID=UPI0013F5AA15|nr:5-formyltetrahydrofolate cyclo-ligase [Actinopolyspora sp. BKK2]NHE78097.1 5-formyltetrahydrofolate cyclo-ligase [Actinopolyspora sp. BKK1]
MTLSADELARKEQWRRELTAGRSATSGTARAEANEALRTAVLEHLRYSGATTVCAYVPVGSEPGSLELVDGIREHGCRVLLPIVTGRQPLEWAEYTGPDSLSRAGFGLLEPNNSPLGIDAISTAELVLVPALAVDRRGVRLGKGAGYYDRSLPLASGTADLLAVVRDEEFVENLPAEAHDVRVHGVFTPSGGLSPLPR